MDTSNQDERVLLLAPIGQDAVVMARVLAERGLTAQVCVTPAEVCAHIHSGAGAIVLTEEALELPHASEMLEALKAQPAWSELPLIILTAGREPLARLLDV